MRIVFLALILSIATALVAAAQEDGGRAAYDRGDYEAAMAIWQPLAGSGDAEAQYGLGLMYSQGQGVTRDLGQAADWYRRAAEQGHGKAQTNLGRMYYKGQGVPQDDGEAVKWYRKAAMGGTAYAQANLGSMYADGRGVPRNAAVAVKWYRKAAEQGNDLGQFNLAQMYMSGDGVPRDLVQAHMWFELAARSFSLEVIAGMNRDAVAKDMTPDQIADADRGMYGWISIATPPIVARRS